MSSTGSHHAEALGTLPVGKLLVKLSGPAILGMMVNSLYNLVDTIFVGKGVGTHALAALAVCFPVQILFLAVAQTVGVGSASIISRRLGAGKLDEAERVAGGTFLLVTVMSLLLSALGLIFLNSVLRSFGASDVLMQPSRDYLSIILMGGFFFAMTVCSNSIARAEGNAKVAMISMLIGAGTNVALDPIFIFVFGMGIRGAAIATVIGRSCAFIWIIRYFATGRSHLKIHRRHLIPKLSSILEIFRIGSPSFARVSAASLLAIVINNTVMHYGTDVHLAVLGVTNRMMIFALMPLFGLVQGLQPAVGYNYGARLFGRVRKAVRLSIRAAIALTTFFFLIFELFPGFVLGLFSNDPILITEGRSVLRIMVAAMPLIGFQTIGAGVFQALGRAGTALLLSISRQILFLIPLAILLPRIIMPSLTGVWIAFPAADILATAVTAVFFYREFRRLKLSHSP